jgi:hypothetical protein
MTRCGTCIHSAVHSMLKCDLPPLKSARPRRPDAAKIEQSIPRSPAFDLFSLAVQTSGEVTEWSKVAVSKTVVPFGVPRVRIPTSPLTNKRGSLLSMPGAPLFNSPGETGRFQQASRFAALLIFPRPPLPFREDEAASRPQAARSRRRRKSVDSLIFKSFAACFRFPPVTSSTL